MEYLSKIVVQGTQEVNGAPLEHKWSKEIEFGAKIELEILYKLVGQYHV